MRAFSPIGQENLPSACAVPAQILSKNKRDNPVPTILVPPKLTVERTGNEIKDAQREPVHMHLRFQPAILILPYRGFEGR